MEVPRKDLAGHVEHRMHEGLPPRTAAQTNLKTMFTSATEDTHGLTPSVRTRQRQVARAHAHHPNISIKKDINNSGLQEADPLSSFVSTVPIKRDWMNYSGEKHIREVTKDDNLSRKVIPEPRETHSEVARRKLKEHERRSNEVETYEQDIQRAHESMRNALVSNFSEETLKNYVVEIPEFSVNDAVLIEWGKQWMQGKVMKVEESRIRVSYHGHNAESERWIELGNGRIRHQTMYRNLHYSEHRRGAFPKIGDGVIVRVIDSKFAEIFKGLERVF